MNLTGFEIISKGGRILLPINIPIVSLFINRLLVQVPLIKNLCLTWYIVARLLFNRNEKDDLPSVSVIIPTRNEKGNIESAFKRIPKMGKWTELVFIDGQSSDGTIEEIERCRDLYHDQWKRILMIHQEGKGKGDAVRNGFERAEGDILMILDSDLTMPPENLPKFYDALIQRIRGIN